MVYNHYNALLLILLKVRRTMRRNACDWEAHVGQQVKRARLEANLTQEEIASRCGLAPLTVSLSTGRPVVFPALSDRTYLRLPAFIADSLPDRFGSALIDAWMADRGISRDDITPLDRLAYMGRRAMGALEFRLAARAEKRAQPLPQCKSECINGDTLCESSGPRARLAKERNPRRGVRRPPGN